MVRGGHGHHQHVQPDQRDRHGQDQDVAGGQRAGLRLPEGPQREDAEVRGLPRGVRDAYQGD